MAKPGSACISDNTGFMGSGPNAGTLVVGSEAGCPTPAVPPAVVRNGPTRTGEPTCHACGRQFVAAPRKVPAADEAAVERMRAERLGVRAIARITGRSRSWLRGFVDDLSRRRTRHAPGRLKKSPAT